MNNICTEYMANFDEFAFLKENRPKLSKAKYQKLKKQIETNGYLIQPIIINTIKNMDISLMDETIGYWREGRWAKWNKSKTPKYVIIEGQNRFAIHQELNIPVLCTSNPNVTRDDIKVVNNTSSPWQLIDFVKFEAEKNTKNAKILYEKIRQYKKMGFGISAIHRTFNGESKNIKSNPPIIEINPKGDIILHSCFQLKDYLPNNTWKHEKIVAAIESILNEFPAFNVMWVIEGIKSQTQSYIHEYNVSTSLEENVRVLKDLAGMGKRISFNEKTNGTCNEDKIIESDTFDKEQRQIIFARDNYTCQYCSITRDEGAELESDHIVAIAQGGKTQVSNGQTLCKPCNRSKGSFKY